MEGQAFIHSKTCTGCGAAKPLSDYTWKSKSAGILRSRCRSCAGIAKRSYEKTDSGRKKSREYLVRWRGKNQDLIKGYRESRRLSIPRRNNIKNVYGERIIYFWKRWNNSLKRRTRRSGAMVGGNEIPIKDFALILEFFNFSCAYCGNGDSTLIFEHIIPVSKGGRHTSWNVVPACSNCNTDKSDKIPEFVYGDNCQLDLLPHESGVFPLFQSVWDFEIC